MTYEQFRIQYQSSEQAARAAFRLWQQALGQHRVRAKQDLERSWKDNPDRMGGQFTEDEIKQSSEWR